ncbi:MAG: hypothetical protein R3231_08570 [bacterium]|nr:hypothetical protein [bacterium]
MSVVDTVVHVDEYLDAVQRNNLVERMRDIPGVIYPRFNPGKDHLLSVAFDPAGLWPTDLLENVRKLGYRLELIGL